MAQLIRHWRSGWLIVGTSAALAWSCVPLPAEETGDPATGVPHEDFPIVGGHRAVGCDECHITGAAEQNLTPELPNGWVTAISTGCLGCHTDTRDTIFPTGHKEQASCADAGCHSASDDCWRNVRGDCVIVPPGEPPPPIGHEGDRAILFPLEGAHAGIDCGTCHTGAADEEQRGGAEACEMCHTRPDAAHYPADRNRGPDDDRRCKACHAHEAANGALVVNTDFATDGVDHDLYWPHNRIALGTPPYAPRAETAWVSSCISCHPTPGVQDEAGVECDACHVPEGTANDPGEIALTPIHANFNAACHTCHERGDNL